MKTNENGYVSDWLFAGFTAMMLLFLASLIPLVLFTKWEISEQNVSGIVYNTTNSSLIAGNTNFSIRAGENTPVTAENQSSYCLPPNSKYKELVNRAAGDKRVKVQVTTQKGFWFKAPWTCVDNVTVTEVK